MTDELEKSIMQQRLAMAYQRGALAMILRLSDEKKVSLVATSKDIDFVLDKANKEYDNT